MISRLRQVLANHSVLRSPLFLHFCRFFLQLVLRFRDGSSSRTIAMATSHRSLFCNVVRCSRVPTLRPCHLPVDEDDAVQSKETDAGIVVPAESFIRLLCFCS